MCIYIYIYIYSHSLQQGGKTTIGGMCRSHRQTSVLLFHGDRSHLQGAWFLGAVSDRRVSFCGGSCAQSCAGLCKLEH